MTATMRSRTRLAAAACTALLVISGCQSTGSHTPPEVMDLSVLGKQAIFIPTPGQTEQEYLAAFHKQKHHHYSISQDQFVLEKSIQAARNYSGVKIDYNTDILDAKIDELLSRL